jgi:mono/diheme cytochrome c family protein
LAQNLKVKLVLSVLITLILVGIPLLEISSQAAFKPETTISDTMPTVLPPNLTPPVLPAHPTQADQGQQVYYQVCMVCHGDQGQGLTKEWIAESTAMGPLSCYTAKCHGPAHPANGFLLPKTIPPVRSATIRTSFPTAFALYQFMHTVMPYQAPGSLKDEEYWQLTAFIMRINGADLGTRNLSLVNAKSITWIETPRTFLNSPAWVLWGAGGILVLVGLIGGAILVTREISNRYSGG